ncbi:MAG: ABC transporter substrate-binding protein [Ferrimicrobium sp.]
MRVEQARRGVRRLRFAKVGALILAGALVLSACTGGGSTAASSSTNGSTVTYAHAVGDQFSWILPLPNQANYDPWDQYTEYSMWRPLYYAGQGSKPIVDQHLSLAYPPVWSNNNTTVTIRLKHYMWSDGQPVTTKDIRFFFNLYSANKSNIATYIPGDMPDNVKSIDYVSPTEFVMHLTGSFSQQWYSENELTLIIPMPQQVWDVKTTGGKVGNYDMTPSGARAVFKYLTAQSKTLSTYATNPLWKVVDGPWRLTAYSPTTSQTTLSVNSAYSGPDKPHIAHVVYETPTSATSEVDGLRNGSIDIGYLPLSDYTGLKGYFASHGFTISPWAPEYVQWAELGYTSPVYGPLVKQLYIRQALQHLVNEPLYLKTTLHGLGQLTYGPVPNLPGSPYVSAAEKVDPYPYSVSASRSLLIAHGWSPGAGGIMVCQHPGNGAGQCGPGIAGGRDLNLSFYYVTGYQTLASQVQAFSTAAASAGIGIQLNPESQSTLFALGGVCPSSGPCNWGIILYSSWLWNFGQADVYPTGGQMFSTGNYWGGGYSSKTADHLIALTHTQTGLKYLYNYENYISRQVAGLWFPTWDNRISVVKNSIHGWQPQQAFGNPQPSNWYVTSAK